MRPGIGGRVVPVFLPGGPCRKLPGLSDVSPTWLFMFLTLAKNLQGFILMLTSKIERGKNETENKTLQLD